jgi:ubiquinone biosynthesis protein UbiJ
MSLNSTLASAIETALNIYLKQDPYALARCAELEGKVIGLLIAGPEIPLYFSPGSEGIKVQGHYDGEVGTFLRGSPLGFAQLALGSREDALFQGAVEIKGDTETGEQFQAILAATEWDWEEQLSRVTGDLVAHQAGELARRAKHLASDSRNTLEQDISEYLQEEARLLPTRLEAGNFLEDVDALRADVDRLCARVQRLLAGVDSDS